LHVAGACLSSGKPDRQAEEKEHDENFNRDSVGNGDRVVVGRLLTVDQ
jgi:hypothetical protein